MEDLYIQSRQNEQVKNLVKLRERKHRDRQSRFLVEGLREIGHALEAGFEITHLYYCTDFFPSEAHARFIREQRELGAFPLIGMSPDAFTKASHREGPDGLTAIAIQQNNVLSDFKVSEQPLLLVLEGIEKPGNLGAILRSADGAGVDAVVLVDCVLDLYNPNAIRSSQGLLFALPIVSTDRASLSQWLDEHQILCCATTPDTQELHWDINYRQSIAIFMGSESDGLQPYWLEQAAHKIRIPMAGQADSLNVAAAAAVCLYEARRQRAQMI
ncbi:RNA methyltransferase [Coraliomargarita algicola]|uniref:RNA methyltransferase n=1 Tax=Coraliomargarita algicola TaxID=3092156 RepID=A0ABZ0RLU7_9BACT|nr:RNA methyltransferase [Coraliomargarita sp. J2-16]WPJ96391.1 RNA methyltransferase [Coraliomargarita sp. J2-16]